MRRVAISLSSAALLIGGVIAAASVGVSAERLQTIPSTEPSVVTTEVASTSEAPGTTEGPAIVTPGTEAPATTEGPAASEAPETSAATETSEVTETADAEAAFPPLVGAWLLTDTSDPASRQFVASFSSDGIYHDADPDGSGIGAWEPTGPTSALLTVVIVGSEEEGGGTTTVRASIEVAPDGQSLTAEYTVEVSGEGAPAGQFGPGSVTGTRINVEPMGTPVGSLEDLFAQFAPPTTVAADAGVVTETTSAA